MFIVYILACSDGTFHSGVTKNLEERLNYHERGANTSAYTYNRRPLKLVFQKSFKDIRTALKFEDAIQQKTQQEIDLLTNGKAALKIDSEENDTPSTTNSNTSLIIPISYLGNIAYYSELKNAGEVVLDISERFQKQTYRNRSTISTANGLQNLIVPVIRPNGKATLISELLISYAEDWQKDHIKAIESAYRRAPFYEFYATDLFEIITTKYDKLIDLTKALTVYLLDCFEINAAVRFGTHEEESSIPKKLLMLPKSRNEYKVQQYQQVLNSGMFEGNLSTIDLLFNVGKAGLNYF